MVAYLSGPLLALLPVLLVVAAVVFLLIHLTPGDPARVLLGQDATPEQVQALRHDLGLDKPLIVQFALWLGRAVRGDLGLSIFQHIPVTDDILQHASPTVMLSLLAITVALLIGIPAGVVSAVFRNSWLDQCSLALAMLGGAGPGFLLGPSPLVLFSLHLGWAPSSGYPAVF